MFHFQTLIALVIMGLFTPLSVGATADGPDYFQVRNDQPVALYVGQDIEADIIAFLPAGISGIKNLGCEGASDFAAWQKMSEEERTAAKDLSWCKVSYLGLTGWVQNKYLAEGVSYSAPTFSCDQEHPHEIEALICKNAELILLDHQMDEIYKQALDSAKNLDAGSQEAVDLLKAMQRGWYKGRNECWKDLEDKTACTRKSIHDRMMILQAQWSLVPPAKTVRYICGDDGKEEFYVSFYKTAPASSVAIEYGDQREAFWPVPTASGTKYAGAFGKVFWAKGDEASFTWDQFETERICRAE